MSTFLSRADHNVRFCALHWPDVYAVLQSAHALLQRIGDVLEKDPSDENLLAPRLLIHRSHSAILGATRLAMSGQGLEAQPLLRLAIENAWYALHVAKDPAPPARAKIWWNRETSPEALQENKGEFTVGNVRRTHELLDAATAATMKTLYEGTISMGGHPNERGVAASLKMDRSQPNVATLKVGFLHAGTPAMAGALKDAVDITIGIAKTASLIYPERFQIAGLDEQITQLVDQASGGVFGKYLS